MRSMFVVAALLSSFAAAAADQPSLPPEVVAFITDRDACDHFAGEIEGYTGKDQAIIERQANVNESIEIHYAGTDRRLSALRNRYKESAPVIQALRKYESRVEGAPCRP